MADLKKEWLEKARIDYFTPFTILWLSCNSWYNSHYPEVGNGDRAKIDKIKSDVTIRNHLYNQFTKLLNGSDKNSIKFRNNLEMLNFYLERAQLRPERVQACSFKKILIDYSRKNEVAGYEDIIVARTTTKMTKNGEVRRAFDEEIRRLDTIYVKKDDQKFFAGLIEIIYTIRNMLIHGNLRPGQDEHEVVRYAYFILFDLLEE